MSCTPSIKTDIHGHRGARGIYPENSIEGFLYALESGVDYLEMDVVVSADKRMIVSHEPWISPEICLFEGEELPDTGVYINLYKLTAEEIKAFDCGNKINDAFPAQKKLAAYKPSLMEVVRRVEDYIIENNLPQVKYNIETKSTESGDNLFHPVPEEFVILLLHEITKLGISDRVVIQSFDIRTLRAVRDKKPDIPLALLVDETEVIDEKLKLIGFEPDIISPSFKLLNASQVHSLKKKGFQVVPWTLNKEEDISDAISWKVDGIITDYPELAFNILERNK